MEKIVFIIPSASSSHYKNRIIEFINAGYNIEVYAFERIGQKKDIPQYPINIIARINNQNYYKRLLIYIDKFKEIWKTYKNKNTIFYLGGLDIAMCFHYCNPKADYIYEECDLTYTYLKAKCLFKIIDKKIIKRSVLTILTSEGFLNYHFKHTKPNNIYVIENKLEPSIQECKTTEKKEFDKTKLSIGFVGCPRFESLYNFIDIFCKNFPNYKFHIYGGPIADEFKKLEKYNNCEFHGFFKNPNDLADIYSNIDLVVATYDVKYDNVRYAEPNKLYEAVYFNTPIIVSSNTFLAEKVNKLGIGYDLNPLNENEIISFIENLTVDSYLSTKNTIKNIPKKNAININTYFFEKLKLLMKHNHI